LLRKSKLFRQTKIIVRVEGYGFRAHFGYQRYRGYDAMKFNWFGCL
jgi:hypothetical protein